MDDMITYSTMAAFMDYILTPQTNVHITFGSSTTLNRCNMHP